MTLTEYFALQRGNQAAFVKASGLAQSFVSQLSLGHCPIPVEHGAAIEGATGGLVTRQEMFPDTWARIWPELATPTTDHAAELRAALEQTRIVFHSVPEGAQVLAYLLAVVAADSPATAAWLEGGQLPDREQADADAAEPAPISPLERLKREVFTTSNALMQPADLTVQLLILAELRKANRIFPEILCRVTTPP